MPELLEVELYRQVAAEAIGRNVVAVDAPDAWYLKRGLDAAAAGDALLGTRLAAARRRGKLLLLDWTGPSDAVTLGLRFGMTGRLLLDGWAVIERLEYSSDRDDAAWDRFIVTFDDGGQLRLRDPRRLGGVELEPDETALGPDAAEVRPAQLGALLRSRAPLKARLMDQRHLAGMGNLLTDECLWRAGLDPARAADSLSPAELRRLHRHLHLTLEVLGARGGSHLGDLHPQRHRGGICPNDGAPLERRTVGGRTTYSCPVHQR